MEHNMQPPPTNTPPLDRPRLHQATRLLIAISDAYLHRTGNPLHDEDFIEARLHEAVKAVHRAANAHHPIAVRVSRGNLVDRIAHLLRWYTNRHTDSRARNRPAIWPTTPLHWHPGLTGDDSLSALIADEFEAVRERADEDLDFKFKFKFRFKSNFVPESEEIIKKIAAHWKQEHKLLTDEQVKRPAVAAYILDRHGPVQAAASLIAEFTDESIDTLIQQHRNTGYRHRGADLPTAGDEGHFFGAAHAPGLSPLTFLSDALSLRWVARRFLSDETAGPLLHDAQTGGAGWEGLPPEAHLQTIGSLAAVPIDELTTMIADRRTSQGPLAATQLATRLRRLNQSVCLGTELASLLAALKPEETSLEALVNLWSELLPWDRTESLASMINALATEADRTVTWRDEPTPEPERHNEIHGHWYEQHQAAPDDDTWRHWFGPRRLWHPGPAINASLLRSAILTPKP